MSADWGVGTGDARAAGAEMLRLMEELYPICRSITGEGVRQTLGVLRRHLRLEVHEVPSGTPVFDWTVPKEWNIRDAYVKNPAGERVVDFQRSNLHVVGYSRPIRARLPLRELRPHLFTLPEHPSWVPYRTSYYADSWGFCLSHDQLLALADQEYEVCIDATLEDGHLTYGELYLPGTRREEILISCHVCHPSLCNDNLSGIAVATLLGKMLGGVSRRYSYRFLFIPGTIGSITWLSRNEDGASRIAHGLTLTCLGDAGRITYKRSRRGNAAVDRAAVHVLASAGDEYRIVDFSPYGYDERQFCSPGFNLAVGSLMRSSHGEFPEYHTSADNLGFVRQESLVDSLAKLVSILFVLEHDACYVNTNPKCEPQLGKRGLYRAIGGASGDRTDEMAMLWVLNQSDGGATLLDIAERARLPFTAIHRAAERLAEHGLLREVAAPRG